MTEPLLKTKLFVPTLNRIVARPRLTAAGESGLEHRPLTLVSAPPGYGKTTLIVDYLQHTQRPFTWLALDEGDNDPTRFFTYLVAALQRIDKNIGAGMSSLLEMPQLPSVEPLVTALINDITAAPVCTLVLDDYHVIRTPAIHAAIEFLVQHLPPNLHLILITREDPSFSLARLRVRGQLAEIRADDLRFSSDEADSFLRQVMQLALDDRAVSVLHARTEGWIAGLQLAALSLQGQDTERVDDFLRDFGGSHRFVIDYLLDEVLRRQTEDARTFLCQTAILNRFNAALCDAVTGRVNSENILAQLRQQNLFLVSLDSRREWYRYHHLFADSLRTELDAARQAPLHRRAAQWYEANGLHTEALEHALAGQDTDRAARLMEQVASDAFQRGELATLTRWLDALPEATVRASPNLTALKGWACFVTGDAAAATAITTGRLDGARGADTTSRGRFIALCANIAQVREQLEESRRLAHQALDLIDDGDPFFRLLALQTLGDVQHQSGQTDAATATFRSAFELGEKLGHSFAALIPFTSFIPNLNRQGRRREALSYCQRALDRYVDARGNPLPLVGLVYAPLGMLYYEANELQAARDYIVRGLATHRALGMEQTTVGDGEWTLARIQWAAGQTDAALSTAHDTRLLAERAGMSRMAFLFAGIEANFVLKQGDVQRAAQWVQDAHLALDLSPNPAYELVYFTWARVLLAQQRLDEVQILLGSLKENAQQGGRAGRLITIYLLQALAQHALGNQTIVIDRLESAVRLAAPEDYRRAFLDEGSTVAELLPRARHTAPAFVDSLLSDFGLTTVPFKHPSLNTFAAPARPEVSVATDGLAESAAAQALLSEPLSDRELEVLRLLADGKTNAEIAQALIVTVGTAKWHVHHVLEKLGAGNRTQAVMRARQLRLL